MKLIFLILICSVVSSCKQNKNKNYILKSIEEGLYYSVPKTYEKLHGNVKTINEYNYDYISDSKSQRALNSKFLFEFDVNGKEIAVCNYDPNNNLKWKTTNIYNVKGKLSNVL